MSVQGVIGKLFPFEDLYATMRRFPASVLCSFILFIISIMIVHGILDDNENLILRLLSLFGVGYFWFGIVRLIAESSVWGCAKEFVVGMSGLGVVAALVFSTDLWGLHLLFLSPALLLFLMFAPYLRGGDDLSVWFFNRRMWLGVLISYIALFLFAGGVSTALWAIEELFGLNVPSDLYTDLWLFASLVLGPLYALSWVPQKFSFVEEDCTDPPGLTFIVNWISAPMVFVYLGILYAYFIKIIVTGDVPNGHLAYMISGFVGAGILTYLAAYPLRDDGRLQLRLFYKIFFPSLIVPVGFHFYAIWERVGAYGITEQRYMLIVSALWFAIIAIGNLFGRMPIKAIPMTLAILMVLSSFGPWGAVSVSGQSQFKRLEMLLERNDLLSEGQIVKVKDGLKISFEDRKSISSILDYLCRSDRDALLEPWFHMKEKYNTEWSCSGGYNLTESLGFEYVNKYMRRVPGDRFKLIASNNRKKALDVAGYDFVVMDNFFYRVDSSKERKIAFENGTITFDGTYLTVILEERAPIKIDLYAFAKERMNVQDEYEYLSFVGESEDIAYRIHFTEMNGVRRSEEQFSLRNLIFDFIYRVKD